jgi:raffinose/stachyose/melibiose transport system permease protein
LPSNDLQARPSKGGRSYRCWFAAPSILLVTVFFALPFLANGVLSFTRWTGFSSHIKFAGLGNFEALQALGILGHATKVTLIFALITMATQNLTGLALAKALQGTNRVNTVFRAIFFVPVLMSPLAAGYIWAAMLAPQGPINQAIGWIVPGFDFAWLGHPTSALVMVGLIDGWKWSGLAALVYVAGLNSIPRPVIEAAILDGAGAIRRFFLVELPLLAPALTFNITITLVGSFSALDVIFSTTKGGPGDATSVLNAAVYMQYGAGLFGQSSALSFTIALMVIVTALPLIFYLRKREVTA